MVYNTTNALLVEKSLRGYPQRLNCSLVFFVFFDGTNNNKLQVAKSWKFRDKILLKRINGIIKNEKVNNKKDIPSEKIGILLSKKYIIEQNTLGIKRGYQLRDKITADEIRLLGKNFWKDILSNEDLDSLYYGYEKINEHYMDYVEKDVNYDTKINKNITIESSYTNVAILDSLFTKENTSSVFYHSFYIEGCSTSEKENDSNSRLVGQGFGRGSQGVYAKLKAMISKIKKEIYSYFSFYNIDNIDYYVFGFSRGATTARMFTHTITCELENGKPRKKSEDIKTLTDTIETFHKVPSLTNTKIAVKYLGIYDTVASINYNTNDNYTNNVKENFLFSTNKVEYTFHLVAIDEYRKNFALVDIQSSINNNNGTEIFIPGCHTDIGGGRSIEEYHRTNDFIGKCFWLSFIHSFNKIQYKELKYDQKEDKDEVKNILINMGWAKRKEDIEIKGQITVDIRRSIVSGYSNIGLSLMVESVNKKLSKTFTTVDGTPYCIPSDLKNMYKDVLSKINIPGRFFLYPPFPSYSKLRTKYLQLSCDNGIVNLPSYKTVSIKGSESHFIMRIIATGLPNSNKQYMCDYPNVAYQEINGI